MVQLLDTMKRLVGKRGQHKFDPGEVLYLTGSVNYCYLHLSNGDVILTCRTLKWFADQWPTFLRVHRHTLVNSSHVHDYHVSEKATASSHVVMTNKVQIEVARRRTGKVARLLTQLRLPTE